MKNQKVGDEETWDGELLDEVEVLELQGAVEARAAPQIPLGCKLYLNQPSALYTFDRKKTLTYRLGRNRLD